VDLLNEWGIRTSEDVGRIVFGSIKLGLLLPTKDDRIEDFNGIFTLANLFTKPF
jgi:uncharacterized repeat protein (TIGR04138 family)